MVLEVVVASQLVVNKNRLPMVLEVVVAPQQLAKKWRL